jgi:hypothetical protein
LRFTIISWFISSSTMKVMSAMRRRDVLLGGFAWAQLAASRTAVAQGAGSTYTYAPGRGAVHALELLDRYRGIVQCDGYVAYKTIANSMRDEAITLAFCWAHLRRRFYDIAESGPAPIASEALERIAALYAIEKAVRGPPARTTGEATVPRLARVVSSWGAPKGLRPSVGRAGVNGLRHVPPL